ncbi:MAG: sensor histidine kinase [Verrucomicrobiota bacterium]
MLDARRKTSFVSNVSHELKTPLTSLRMFAELLRENRVSGDAKRREYLGVIVEESERLTRLVNNILDFGRLEQNRRKYNLERINVSDFVKNFERNHSERISNGGLVLKIEVPEQPMLIKADRDALNQVMLNLADNALKYAAEGGELIIRVEQVDDRCFVEFMDRGPGVPADHAERIFEKFYRVDQELTAEKSGSGLGLSIARGLLRGMGGDILYAVRKSGGARFIMIFPSERPAEQEEA